MPRILQDCIQKPGGPEHHTRQLRPAEEFQTPALGIDLKSPTPKLHVIEIPFLSLGIEASLYCLKAKLTVGHVSINVGRRVTVDEGVDLP